MLDWKNKWNKNELKRINKLKKSLKGKRDFAGDTSASELIRISKKYIGLKVLDVGAGSGALIKLIPNALGLDAVPQNADIIEGDINDLPFKEDSFDTIFATEVFEHLDEKTLNKGLIEIDRCLKKGGHLIITVPYKEDIYRNLVICPNCELVFHPHAHVQVFDKKKIIQILDENNFSIIDLKVIPISFMANHYILKHFIEVLKFLGFFKANNNLFVIARNL